MGRLRWLRRVSMKYAPEESMAVTSALAVGRRMCTTSGCAKRFVLGILVSVLLTVVDLLLERLGFFLVGKR